MHHTNQSTRNGQSLRFIVRREVNKRNILIGACLKREDRDTTAVRVFHVHGISRVVIHR